MQEDVRDKPYLSHQDVVGLNFIRDPERYRFRRHYRAGLRSHIMEVLDPDDVGNETKGIIVNGLRWYPRAEPVRILRIFRTRFKDLAEALEEVKRVNIVQTYLAPDHVALTEEFLVDYKKGEERVILLCGLQEYVEGEDIGPWSNLGTDHLISLLYRMGFKKGPGSAGGTAEWIGTVQKKAEAFVGRIKQMIREAGHIPDLAGEGNLLITSSGHLKLVDVNNISRVIFDSVIYLDDRGYPVCDKSIEALSLLEQKLLGRSPQIDDPIYETFLDPGRMKAVKEREQQFHHTMNPAISQTASC